MRLGCTCDRGPRGRAYDPAIHCPACWTFWHSKEHNLARGGDGNVFEVRREPIVFPEQTCVHRGKPTGEVDQCHTCMGEIPVPLIQCGLLKRTCFTGNYTVPGSQACARCPHKDSGARSDVGVVIGSYRYHRTTEANILLIKRTCGNVPILVNDDSSENQEEIRRVCTRLGVDFVSTKKRLGHCGGDAAAFGHGLLWAKDRGINVLAKLSMRVWMLGDRWLQRGAEELIKSGLPLACQDGNFGKHRDFPLRSEAGLLRVDQWNPDVFFRDDKWYPMNGEEILFAALPGTKYHPWSELPAHRERRVGHMMSHWTHEPDEYRSVAKRLGVVLDPGFHGGGWELEDSRGEYLWG